MASSRSTAIHGNRTQNNSFDTSNSYRSIGREWKNLGVTISLQATLTSTHQHDHNVISTSSLCSVCTENHSLMCDPQLPSQLPSQKQHSIPNAIPHQAKLVPGTFLLRHSADVTGLILVITIPICIIIIIFVLTAA